MVWAACKSPPGRIGPGYNIGPGSMGAGYLTDTCVWPKVSIGIRELDTWKSPRNECKFLIFNVQGFYFVFE